MAVLLVIPARYASTRYPGKPLVELTGATGEARSLIRRSWEAAITVPGVDRVVVATDDERIAAAARAFGAEVAMTPDTCRNGTERCALVARDLGGARRRRGQPPGRRAAHPALVRLGARSRPCWPIPPASSPPRCCAATPRRWRASSTTAATAGSAPPPPSSTAAGRALYFSKEVIPYTGRPLGAGDEIPVFHHVGVYAYRRAALDPYPDWPMGPLETWEGLEQLRFMENGLPVHCVEVDARGRAFWELNNPNDVPRIEAILRRFGLP